MNDLRPITGGAPDEGAPPVAADPADLLRRSARGDAEAFARLYDATSAKVYGLAVRVVRDPAQAEEVAQESYLEVWRTAARFDPARGSAVAWMLTIVHRRAVDRVRSAESATRRDAAYHHRTQPISHDETAEAATASLEAHRVRAALASLTSVQREAVELSYLQGDTHTEIATMLDLPIGTAKTRIRDGLIRLRDTMGVGSVR